MRLCFATHNPYKLQEVQALMPSHIELVGLDEIGAHEDIPETASTLQGNALLKAQYIWNHYHIACFADDTGLEVTALNGAPGVYSARYAGTPQNSHANCSKLLQELQDKRNREAQFKTVICLLLGGQTHFFEGVVKGQILREPKGQQGFGYDPLFQPQGFNQTFAEMSPQQKNSCSHRALAIERLVNFLKDQ